MANVCPNKNSPEYQKLKKSEGDSDERAHFAYYRNGQRIPTPMEAMLGKLHPEIAKGYRTLHDKVVRAKSSIAETLINEANRLMDQEPSKITRVKTNDIRVGANDTMLESVHVWRQHTEPEFQEWYRRIAESPNLTGAKESDRQKVLSQIKYAMEHSTGKAEQELNERLNDAYQWDLGEQRMHLKADAVEAKDYLPGVAKQGDSVVMPNGNVVVFEQHGGGGGTPFFKEKVFPTILHAVEAGYVQHNYNAADVFQHHAEQVQRLIGRNAWLTTGYAMKDEIDGNTAFAEMNEKGEAPKGYQLVAVGRGKYIAVHNGYTGLVRALTAESIIKDSAFGTGAKKVSAYLKHGTLLFDLFHLMRVRQFGLGFGVVNYEKGKTLVNYSDAAIDRMVASGEMLPEFAAQVKAERPWFELGTKYTNLGRIEDALYKDMRRDIPIIGKFIRNFNRYTFEEVAPSLMAEISIREAKRAKANHPEWTNDQISRAVGNDVSLFFGNIGRNRVFKNQSFQDTLGIILLAPNWVESMATRELKFIGKDIPHTAATLLKTGKIDISTNARGVASGLAMYFIAAQILNLSTRGKFTFENEEENHKLDAWIPDVTGKTDGYFMSPLSVFAEYTYDALKYSEKKDTGADALNQIINNKLGPIGRSINTLWTGQDVFGQKLRTTWDRVATAAISAAPVPIFASGFISPFPGMAQKQIMATAGIKTDLAPTANQQMMNKAKRWLESQGIEAPSQQVYYADSPWKKYRMAIKQENESLAKDALADLLKTRNLSEVKMQLETQGGARPFTGQKGREEEFIKTLDPQEKAMYQHALQERTELKDKGLAMLAKIAPAVQAETPAAKAVKKFKAAKKARKKKKEVKQ